MDNELKAKQYDQLMIEYTRTQNQISSIRGIRDLEGKLRFLMEAASRL